MSKKIINDIIIITKHFPFKPIRTPGESFLKNELPVISRHADHVHIFCTEVTEQEREPVALPENATAYVTTRHGTKYDKIVSYIRGILSLVHPPVILREDLAGKPLDAQLYGAYFYQRGAQKYARILKLLKKVRLEQNVLIYSYWCYDHAYAAIKLKEQLAPHHHTFCFSRAHRYDLYEYNHRFSRDTEYLPLRKWLFKHLDRVLPCSMSGRHYLCEKYPAFKDKFSLSYIGTLDHGEQPLKRDQKIHLCSCSRLVSLKRVERLADAVNTLQKKGYAIQWTHFGGGQLYDKLVKKAQSELAQCECLLPGYVKNEDVLKYYSQHRVDLFINVSASEGLPISIMEAASFGIPIIATDVGGTSEIVRHGENGYLIPGDFTDEALVAAIETFIQCGDRAQNDMRRASRSIWQQNFQGLLNAHNMISEMERAFDTL